MKHSDFRTGTEFHTDSGRWRCTDIGTRTITAIKLDHDDDPSWYNGPPYAVTETVFDEYDFEACRRARRKKRTTEPVDSEPMFKNPWTWTPPKYLCPTIEPAIHTEPLRQQRILGRLIRELMDAHHLTPDKLADRVFPHPDRKANADRQPFGDHRGFKSAQAEQRNNFAKWIAAIAARPPKNEGLVASVNDLCALDLVFGFELGHFAHVNADDCARRLAATDATFLAAISPFKCTTRRQHALRDFAHVWRSRFER